jgi:DNA (cytosine-5)-methyltransferase 1
VTGTHDQPTFVDLFAGAGGFTAGLESCGLRPTLAVESSATAASTYRHNFGNHVTTDEIQKVKEFPSANVVIGGPPCQGFSLLGTRSSDDDRNELWRHFWRAVRAINPEIFVLENVRGFIGSEQHAALLRVARRSEYVVESQVLNAADYGAPQTRRRAIVIGRRGKAPIFPWPTHSEPGRQKSEPADRWTTVREAFADIPWEPDREPPNDNRPITTRDLHYGRSYHETSLVRYGLIPPGGNRFDLQRVRPDLTPPCWLNRSSTGSTDVFGRLWWDRPAVTIRTEFHKPEKGRYLHPEANRPITPFEAARLQGFGDDFLWDGSRVEIARQIGNAVPIPLATAIGNSIMAMIGGEVDPRSSQFSEGELDCMSVRSFPNEAMSVALS